jgi:hypothetical protein
MVEKPAIGRAVAQHVVDVSQQVQQAALDVLTKLAGTSK